MTAVLKAVLDYVAPLPPEKEKDQVREQFVRTAVTGIALHSLSTGLACYFSISNDLRWEYMKQGITLGFLYLAKCTVSTLCRYTAISERGLFFRTVSLAVDYNSLFYKPVLNMFQVIFHEGGHAVSAYLLYKNYTVQLTATALTNWQVDTKTEGLSKLGSYLGEHYADIMVIAMGPLVDVVTSQISLIGALILKASYPELSKNLFLYTCSTSRNVVAYAWRAFDPNESSINDYVSLWKKGGIHPYVAIIGMVAMPLISSLGYLVLRRQS